MQISYDNLSELRAQNEQATIAYTSGCFDLLHRGHLKLLSALGCAADIAVVGITPDVKVSARKGCLRPVQPESVRAAVIDAIKGVDYTFITPEQIEGYQFVGHAVLRTLRPDVFLTGENIWERDRSWIEEQGTSMSILTRSADDGSTTELIESLLNRAELMRRDSETPPYYE